MILGAVLAGGRSSRFGTDKALALWRGRPLIEHVVAALQSVSQTIVICGRAHGSAAAIPDRPMPDLGPLGGLNAALHHARAHGFDRVVTAPCDTPLLDEGLLDLILSSAGDAWLADMPVIGIWRSEHAAALDAHLQGGGDRSMRRWARLIDARPLAYAAPFNINRPADLEMLDGR
ncbi:molybdenum cofactor guanylyltransferase [Sphingomonas sp. BIUV-7]|uniref:Molybdenum cofactor guanylyltransferase n=1 Tax=Sphingomonas natans TaxID=3063330 RepID=A0ABT8YED7_9SPHN|nr:molybdenum cofactor guanylyltransferase [Sphingomonas sp. BIUV-7]MDO6416722.1 molybdenum cofactor guanylyltransferase [Sphingomonas sp. BIUV-7]